MKIGSLNNDSGNLHFWIFFYFKAACGKANAKFTLKITIKSWGKMFQPSPSGVWTLSRTDLNRGIFPEDPYIDLMVGTSN